jgi:hypothetical protein
MSLSGSQFALYLVGRGSFVLVPLLFLRQRKSRLQSRRASIRLCMSVPMSQGCMLLVQRAVDTCLEFCMAALLGKYGRSEL